MKEKIDETRPIYLQIKEYIIDSILNDSIQAGERAPSTNEMAKFYQINPATARQGMNELVIEGVLRKQRGVGMFVTEDAKEILIHHRKEQFYRNYIIPLKNEARKLQISESQLMDLLQKEEE